MTLARREFLALAGAMGLNAADASRIRVGCQTRAYGSPIPDRERLLAVLDDLAAAGYEGFETNFNSLQASFGNPGPVRAEIDKRRIGLIGLHCSAGFHDPARAAAEHQLVSKVARAVRDFGGTHLMLSGPGVPRDGAGVIDRSAIERRCAELNKAGRLCRELGVRLSCHNHARELHNDAEELRLLLKGTDSAHVSLLLDVSYVYLGKLDPSSLLGEIHPRLAGLHVRDMKGAEEAVMGTGEIDYRAVGDTLRRAAWSGWVIFEMNPRKDMSSRDLVVHARKYMRSVMQI